MTKILTEPEIQRIMRTWVNWYDMHGVAVDMRSVVVGPQPPGYDFPILNATEMPCDQVNTVFRKELDSYGIAAFTAPVERSCVHPDGSTTMRDTLTFTDLISPSDRVADSVSYVFWVKKHFKVRQDGSFKSKEFDTRMTVEEAMLYHLYWLWEYSFRYLGHHYSDYHDCRGSKGRHGLRFDLQDIKVCLD